MERDLHRLHIPYCQTRVPVVDQYMWPEKDTSVPTCENGVSHPIYACNGNISRTLPLDMWPRVGEVHPQIIRSSQPHFMARDPRMRQAIMTFQLDKEAGRTEGFYL